MIEVTEKEFKEDLTKYTTRVQNGEDFLVEREDDPFPPQGCAKNVTILMAP